jgi:hypothetical protein
VKPDRKLTVNTGRTPALTRAQCVWSLVAAGCLLHGVSAYAARPAERPPFAGSSATPAAASAAHWRSRDSFYYKRNWGVEIIGIKPVSSGYMLAFRYRVLDPEKAKVLNDRHSRAYLRDEATGTVLAVPAMENIGELRTGSAPEADRTYFMIFGNPGKLVKSGSRVTVVAGNLHIDGLIVD